MTTLKSLRLTNVVIIAHNFTSSSSIYGAKAKPGGTLERDPAVSSLEFRKGLNQFVDEDLFSS